MNASNTLKRAAALMDERGKQYDKPGGERSADPAAAAFNAITGHRLTAADVCLLQLIIKLVRSQTAIGAAKVDSLEDGVAYAALLAEAAQA